MDINRKIVIVSILIVILLVILFGTLKIINRKSQPNNLAKKKEISVYFSTQEAMYLTAEKRLVGQDKLYKNTVEELILGPSDPVHNRTVPEGVKVRDIKVEEGLARVDFNRALVDNHWGGSTGERMTVYSIVNTLTQFDEIDRVLILIDGQKVDTLAGHLDLSSPIEFNDKIIQNSS